MTPLAWFICGGIAVSLPWLFAVVWLCDQRDDAERRVAKLLRHMPIEDGERHVHSS